MKKKSVTVNSNLLIKGFTIKYHTKNPSIYFTNNESSIFIIIMYHLELTPKSYKLSNLLVLAPNKLSFRANMEMGLD
jgi:hypothetical protein